MERTIVITGASDGMGRETAIQMGESTPSDVCFWLIARRRPKLEETAQILTEQGHPVRIIEGDLSTDSFFDSFRDILQSANPQIIALVNAAGFGKSGEVEELGLKSQEDMIRVNCLALMRMCKICLPFIPLDDGLILNYASASAFLPQSGFSVYAASKAFVLSFSESLGDELKDLGIRVTAVCPGPVRTGFHAIASEYEDIPEYKKRFMAEPEAVVRKALADAEKGKAVSVYGTGMKLLKAFSGILPHRLVFAVTDYLKL